MSWTESGVVRGSAIALGVACAAWFLTSAVRTVVIPRPERVWLTTRVFGLARWASSTVAARFSDPENKHWILGAFAPVVLVSLPLVWSLGLIASFSGIFWGLEGGSYAAALELSGSSLTTLGFIEAPTLLTRFIAIVEALLGLAIVALIISFLPTLYSTFSRREVAVGRLTTRAGEPPTPLEFIVRLHAIDRLDSVGERWDEWEQWFTELGETHTSFPALIFFRSARRRRSWLSAAETALDTASLITATRLVESTGQAQTLIRSGYLALRTIADFFGVEAELDPDDRESLSVSRPDFERLLDQLEDNGMEIPVSRDDAWFHFSGWRINYDRALVGLGELVVDVPSHWTSPRPYTDGAQRA